MDQTTISSMKKKVFIWGASGHALFVMNIISLHSDIEVVGLIDDINIKNVGKIFNGIEILGGRDVLSSLLSQGVSGCVFGFGNCSARMQLGDLVLSKGFDLVTVIHPKSIIASTASIGAGVVIGPSVVVDAGCVIEDNCILNNSSCISHGSHIGAGTHICPGVTLGGDVTVGNGCWVGIGSTVIQKMSIGTSSYIGAGSLVTKNIPDRVLAYGAPARVVKKMDHEF